MKQKRRNSFEKLQMQNRQIPLVLRSRLTLNQGRTQNPVEYLRWSFLAKIFKD